MFWKFKKIHEQPFLKDKEKLEELPETVQKIHDLKKASAGKFKEPSVDIIQNINRMASPTW